MAACITLGHSALAHTTQKLASSSSRRPAAAPRHRCSLRVAAAATAPTSPYAKLEAMTCDLSAFPDCKFFRVEALIRPWRLDAVVKALDQGGIRGMTVANVVGAGVQGGRIERYAGTEFGAGTGKYLVEKTRVDIVCARDQVDSVARIIATAAYTGEIGDGKIFVHPVADIIRIRTADTGPAAERMEGGRRDMGFEELKDAAHPL